MRRSLRKPEDIEVTIEISVVGDRHDTDEMDLLQGSEASMYRAVAAFLHFELAVLTVSPDAPIIPLILADQWLLNLDFSLAEIFAARQIIAAALAEVATKRDRIEPLVSPP